MHVGWNQTKAVHYSQASKVLAVYTTKPTKRAVPSLAVRVQSVNDARTLMHAAQATSAAPRLDIV